MSVLVDWGGNEEQWQGKVQRQRTVGSEISRWVGGQLTLTSLQD